MVGDHELDERIFLTADGRALARARLEELREELGSLSVLIESGQDDTGEVARRYQRARDEEAGLITALEEGTPVDDLPEDPETVVLGDTAVIELDNGAVETFVVVHPTEAKLDDERISARSPLGEALLGRKVGQRIEVGAPGGAYRCRILRAERAGRPGV